MSIVSIDYTRQHIGQSGLEKKKIKSLTSVEIAYVNI